MMDQSAWDRVAKILRGKTIATIEIRGNREIFILFDNKMRLFINVDDDGQMECSLEAGTIKNEKEINSILGEICDE